MAVIQTPGEMEAAMIKTLPEKTGYPLSFWLEKIKISGVEPKTNKIGQFLKSEFNFPHGIAYVTAQIYLNGGKPVYGDPEALLQEQYKKQPEFRELYKQLVDFLKNNFSKPLKFGVCKGYVSILGRKQIAVIVPKKNEIRLGLALKGTPFDELVMPAKSLGANEKNTHQMVLKSKENLNQNVIKYIELAYSLN